MAYRRPDRLASLRPSQIRENMRIAAEVGAINMAQGRPDFPAADAVKQAAIEAIRGDLNQYSVTWGVPELREAVAAMLHARYGLEVDPERETTITCGVTEAMCDALMATVQPGDDVLVIEPAHENYVPAIHFCGANPTFLPLRAPNFRLEADALEAALTERTRVIIVNTPHNPSGRVFDRGELEVLAEACRRRDLLLLTDEIYDRLTYDGRAHVPPATLPGMAERTMTTGGISKIHCVTGWRLGYVVAPPAVTDAIRVVHDYTTICAPSPLQYAAVVALQQPESYFEALRDRFDDRRRRMMEILTETGFQAHAPEGAYYVMADFSDWGFDGDAAAFTRHLITEVGVATVPGPAFYLGNPELGESLVRFAFAKRADTLDEVHARLSRGFAAR